MGRSRTILGIDITSTAVQLAWRNKSEPLSEHWVEPLPEGIFTAGVLTVPEPLVQLLRPIALPKKIFSAILNIPAQWVTYYLLTISSNLTAEELRLVIEHELQQRLQDDLTDYYYDYLIFELTQVFIIISPRNIVESRLAALKKLSIIPNRVTTSYAVLIQRIFNNNLDQPQAILYVEQNCISLILVAERKLKQIETIAIFNDDFIVPINNLLALLSEYEQVKMELVNASVFDDEQLRKIVNKSTHPCIVESTWKIVDGLIELIS